MARVKNRTTGVVVEVADEKVERLSKFEWEAAGEDKPAPKRRSAKSDDE